MNQSEIIAISVLGGIALLLLSASGISFFSKDKKYDPTPEERAAAEKHEEKRSKGLGFLTDELYDKQMKHIRNTGNETKGGKKTMRNKRKNANTNKNVTKKCKYK